MTKRSNRSLFLFSFAVVFLGFELFQAIQASYISVGSGSGGGGVGSTFFSSTTQAGPNNSAIETSLIGTVTGSTTIPANTFTNGALVEARADGFYSLPGTADSLTLKMKCGATVLASATFTPPAGAVTNGTFKFDLNLTAIGTGGAGAFITNGIAFLSSGTALNDAAKVLNTSNVAFDFTTSCVFDMTAQWGAGQVGETIKGTNAAAWIPGAPVTSVNGQTGAVVIGGFIQTLTAPISGNFTAQNFNTGAGVVTTQVNNSSPVTSITLLQHDPNNTGNITALDKAKIAATFTITAAFAMTASGNHAFAGLWLSDGGGGPNNIDYFFQNNTNGGLAAAVFTNFTTFSGNVFNGSANVMPVPLVWLRVQETASNRIYSASSDGITFAQIFSEGNTAHFTTSRYGFSNASNNPAGAVNPDGMVTMYSFKETNP